MGRVLAVLGSLALAGLIVLGFYYYRAPPALQLRPGQTLPELELEDHTGKGRLALSALRDHAVVLTIFDANWPATGPYLQDLERLRALYHDRNLVVVGIAVDPIDDGVAALFRFHRINFYVLRDPGALKVRPLFGAPTEPTPDTYVIAPGGRVIEAHAEPVNWRSLDARRALESVLPPPRASGQRGQP
jgi:peroxiredoxin